MVLVAAVGLGATSIAHSFASVGRLFPGFVTWDNLVVVAVGPRTWTGIAADVPFRARVVAMDGAPVARRPEVAAALAAAPAGTVHRYGFATETGPTERAVASMTFGWDDWAATLGVYVLNGVAFVLVGLAVFWLKPEAGPSRAVLAFGVVWGLMLLLCADLFTTGRLDRAYFLVQGLCPAAVLHLALAFPERRAVVRGRRWPIVVPYLAGLAAGAVEIAAYRRAPAVLLAVDKGVWLTFAAAGALSMAGIAHDALRGATPIARRRARVVLTGAVLAFLVPMVALVAFFLVGRPVSAQVLAATGVVFPLAIGYAVARHDLFEADRVVKLSLTYAAVTAIVSVGYGIVVLGAERLASGMAVTTSPLFPIAFVLVALATIVPLRDRVQRAVDRLFYRASVDYKATVARASERLTTLLDRDAIVRHVLATIREVLFIEHATLWEREAGGIALRGGAGAAPGLRVVAADDPAIAAIERRARPLSRDEIRESVRLRDARAPLLALFDRLGADLVVPLVRGGRPAGLLAVGAKASGGPLSADDVDVLMTLANEAAVALATATAVDELAAARAELARAERLAAMGELSAAVAHGIRNPLAGIRLAAQLGVETTRADDPVRENLADVLTEVGKLEARVRGVLDFARPFEPALAPTPLAPVVRSLAETLAPGLAARGVTLRVDVPEALPPARADAALLGQALQELVVNAGEAVPAGGTVTVAARRADGASPGLEVVVADDGPGIPPGMRDRVFQLFMTTKATGTGVGLAVAKKIVERHGGTIRVEDAVPHGTRFVIGLPIAQGTAT